MAAQKIGIFINPRRPEEGPSVWKGCPVQLAFRPLRPVLEHLRRRYRDMALEPWDGAELGCSGVRRAVGLGSDCPCAVLGCSWASG